MDSTAELDRILESGHAPPPSLRSRADIAHSNNSSSTSSSSSDSESPNPRPKITDSLRRVSFSPKRPRSPRTYHSPHHRSSNLPEVQPTPSILLHASSPLARQPSLHSTEEQTQPTPKPRKRVNIFPAHSPQPEVRLQPPTPTSSTSKFTKQARVLSKDIEAEADRSRANHKLTSLPARTTDPNDISLSYRSHGPSKHANTSRSSLSKSKIHLPDVTGLTNAVESPMKGMAHHYPYQPGDEPRESEGRARSLFM